MKTQRGFIGAFLLGALAVAIIAGGVYLYVNNKAKSPNVPMIVDDTNQPSVTPTGSVSSEIHVAGMEKYTDESFGFSFWYPSTWTIQNTEVKTKYTGGTVKKTITLTPPIDQNGYNAGVATIDEFYSPTREIAIPKDLCSPMSGSSVQAHRYYFDVNAHTWMVEVPAYTDYSERSDSEYSVPASKKAANVSTNTMGGLHMLGAGCSGSVIPLSAQNFVVFKFNSRDVGPHYINIAQTITATDPSVATPVSADEQIKTINKAGVLLGAIGARKGSWYVDENNVYDYQGNKVEGVDASKFRVINKYSDGYIEETAFATDGARIYSSWTPGKPVLAEADPATFIPIRQEYQIPYAKNSGRYGDSFTSHETAFSKDKTHVWYHDKMIVGADPATLVVTGSTYVKNSYGIYIIAFDDNHEYGIDAKDAFTIDNVVMK